MAVIQPLSKAYSASANTGTTLSTGPAASWYAGDIQLATGLEHRRYNSEGYAEHASAD